MPSASGSTPSTNEPDQDDTEVVRPRRTMRLRVDSQEPIIRHPLFSIRIERRWNRFFRDAPVTRRVVEEFLKDWDWTFIRPFTQDWHFLVMANSNDVILRRSDFGAHGYYLVIWRLDPDGTLTRVR